MRELCKNGKKESIDRLDENEVCEESENVRAMKQYTLLNKFIIRYSNYDEESETEFLRKKRISGWIGVERGM